MNINPTMSQYGVLSEGVGSVAPGFAARVEQSDSESEEVKRLRETNDLYMLYSPLWEKYLATYEGGDEVRQGPYLHTHPREEPHDFDKRKARVHYINYCKPIIDFFTYFIFSETIQRDGGDNEQWYQKFIQDVNLKGEDIVTFMKQVSDNSQIFGMTYVLVDAPPGALYNGVELTVADVEASNLRPYWALLSPVEVIDWEADAFDTLTYIKRREYISRVTDGKRRRYEKYTEWHPHKIQISWVDVTSLAEPKIDASMGSTIDNEIGEVPIEIIRFERSKRYPFMGNSTLRDFSDNNIEIMNITSEIQEFNYKQCFNILTRQTPNMLPLLDGNEGVVGDGNVMDYPVGVEKPAYLTPPTEGAKHLQTERDYIVQQMFKRAAQDMMSQLFNGEGASGFSQAQNFSKTVPFISNRADTLEAAENRLMSRTLKYLGKTWNGKVKYKDRYELTNITDALNQLLMLFKDLQLPSETFVKEELKRLVHEMDGKLPLDTLQKINAEIDAFDFKAWQETQKEALVGQKKPDGNTQAPNKPTSMAEAAAESKTQSGATSQNS